MNFRSVFFATVFILMSGCAAYELQPLSLDHPANPSAPPAPRPPLSRTLAYSRVDIPGGLAAAEPQGSHRSQHSTESSGAQKTAVGEGKVIATVPNANQLVVEHGEIKDFMEPMTMGYRVEPASLLEGLKPGDQVRFTIDVTKKTIVRIEKLK